MLLEPVRTYLFILLSLSIGVLCVRHIRSKDRYEKEPYIYLLGVTIWGGFCAYYIAGGLYEMLPRWEIYDLENTWGALLIIGPVEEFAKLSALFLSYWIFRKQLNEPVDGLLYMTCVALGFSLIENHQYAMQPQVGAPWILLSRLLISTPAHINFSVFMGLAFYLFVQNKRAWYLLIPAFVYASLAHGVYDMIIFNGYFFFLLAAVMGLAYKAAVGLLGYATAKSNFRNTLWSQLTTAEPVEQEAAPCPRCGNKAIKPAYRLLSQTIQKCDQCMDFITTADGLHTIMHHFAAAPGRSFLGRPRFAEFTTFYLEAHPTVAKSSDRQWVSFDLIRLNHIIEANNQHTIDRMEKRWWFPKGLL